MKVLHSAKEMYKQAVVAYERRDSGKNIALWPSYILSEIPLSRSHGLATDYCDGMSTSRRRPEEEVKPSLQNNASRLCFLL